jgi:hypothetical protein
MRNSTFTLSPVLYDTMRYDGVMDGRHAVSRPDFGLLKRYRKGNDRIRTYAEAVKMLKCKVLAAAAIATTFYVLSLVF